MPPRRRTKKEDGSAAPAPAPAAAAAAAGKKGKAPAAANKHHAAALWHSAAEAAAARKRKVEEDQQEDQQGEGGGAAAHPAMQTIEDRPPLGPMLSLPANTHARTVENPLLKAMLEAQKLAQQQNNVMELSKAESEAAANATQVGEIIKALLAVFCVAKTDWVKVVFSGVNICKHGCGIVNEVFNIFSTLADGFRYLSTAIVFSVFNSDNPFYLGVLFTLLVLNRDKMMEAQEKMDKAAADSVTRLFNLIDKLPKYVGERKDGLLNHMVKFITQGERIDSIRKIIADHYEGNYEVEKIKAMGIQNISRTKIIELMDASNIKNRIAKAVAKDPTPADRARKHDDGTMSEGGRRRTRRRRRGAKSKRKHTKKRATRRRRHSRSKKRHHRRSKMAKRRTKRGIKK